MKELIKNSIRHLSLMNDVVLLGGAFIGGLYLLGLVITVITGYRFGAKEGVLLGGSMMALVAFAYMGLLTASELYGHFNYSLAMGQTRRQTVSAYILAVFSLYVCFELGVMLLHGFERVLVQLCFPGLLLEDPAAAVLHVDYMLLLALIETALTMLIGAAMIKIGKNAFIAAWIIIMAFFIVTPRLSDFIATSDTAFARWLCELAEWVTANIRVSASIGAIGISVIFLLIACLMLRRQRVSL